MKKNLKNIAIVIHGGAGNISRSSLTKSKERLFREALKESLDLGYKILSLGGSSLKAVEKVVVFMEDCFLFNAGKGSVFTYDGTHEMDAAIMNGYNLRAGAVVAVEGIKNPIKMASKVMSKSNHVMLSGVKALEFARLNHIELENENYFFEEIRYQQWNKAKLDSKNKVILDHSSIRCEANEKYGTVGAVAMDAKGNLAVATSTGGMTNKRFGRIGDSPIIGAGTYADNKTCAVSCTGHGEYFMRLVVAHDISCLMKYKGLTLKEASDAVLKKLTDLGGKGGFVGVDSQGNIVMSFNTKAMYRASKKNDYEFVGIFKKER